MTVQHKGQNHYQIVLQKTLRQPTVLYSLKMAMNPFTQHVSMFLLASSGPATIGPPQSLLLLRSSPRNGRGGVGYAQDSSRPAPSPLLLHPWETHAPIKGWSRFPTPQPPKPCHLQFLLFRLRQALELRQLKCFVWKSVRNLGAGWGVTWEWEKR